MAETLGIKLHNTTAYHPQANGIVERFQKHMTESLKTGVLPAHAGSTSRRVQKPLRRTFLSAGNRR